MSEFKVGDKIVFCKCKRNRHLHDVTVGRIYEVQPSFGGVCFYDDVGEPNATGMVDFSRERATKIVE